MENKDSKTLDKKAKRNRIIQMTLGICIPTLVASGISAGITYAIASKQLKLPSYVVTFKNWNGDILQQSKVQIGGDAKYTGSKPTRPTQNYVDYEFDGWDKDLTNIVADREITAQFVSTRQTYTMTWYDDDGVTKLDEKTCYKDEIASGQFPSTDVKPTKSTSGGTKYSFANWNYDQGEGWKTGSFSAKAVYDQATDGLNIVDGKIVSYTGSQTSLTLPTSWEGKTVTTIGTDAFNTSTTNATSVTSVTIPSTITNIEAGAFRNAGALESVSFDNTTITDINESVFSGCGELTEFAIPDTVINVKNRAFYNCAKLTKITIGANVSRDGFDSGALIGCSQLLQVDVSEENQVFSTDASYPGFIFSKDKTVLIRCCPAATFSGTLPSSIIVVTSLAFQGCKNITKVSFENCDNLQIIDSRAFAGSSITEFISGNNITTFGSDVFIQCNNLTKITLGNKVTLDGGWDSFSGCNSLTAIDVTADNEYMESHNGMIYDKKDTTNHKLLRCPIACPVEESGSTTLWNQCKEIGESAFQGCTKLTEYEVPSFIQVINNYAFTQCPNLTKITIGSGDITSIGAEIFNSCSALKELIIGEKLAFSPSGLNASAWSGCSSIETITVDSANTSFIAIDNVLFVKDLTDSAWLLRYAPSKAGTSYSIPQNITINRTECPVKYLGRLSFSDAAQLEKVTLSNSIKKVYDYAFKNCAKLNTLDFASGFAIASDDLGANIFSGCNALKDIILYNMSAEEKQLIYETSHRLPTKDEPINVKLVLSTTEVSNAFAGSAFIKKIDISAYPQTINDYAFYNCDYLEEVVLPNTITKIGQYAFAPAEGGSAALKTLTLPEGLVEISNNAFQGCTKWENFSLPSTVKTIGKTAFGSCWKIKNVDLSNVTNVASWAFGSCVSLTNVKLPKKITIGDNTFASCTALTTVTYDGTKAEYFTNIRSESKKGDPFTNCDNLHNITCTDGDISLDY